MELLTKMPYQQQVSEWQYTTNNDPKTADAAGWIKGPYNTYGKMVSQNFLAPDGTKHAQKKQMEIVQARTSAGAFQVVRAQTVQAMSSRTVTNGGPSLFSSLFGRDTNTTLTGARDSSLFPSSSISLNNIDNRIVVKMRNDQVNGHHEGSLSRGKSISNEDLKANGSEDEEEFGKWSRVSRIRRSLQFPATTAHRSSRPTDFPQESVDVSKIRQELENISRRNSFVKSSSNESSSSFELKETNKPSRPITESSDLTPVTANILQQVRSQLKRLNSNESSKSPDSPSFLRRKSYGFENLESTEAKMESSTDSGLSLSNDLHSPWISSPRLQNRVKLSPTRITLFNDTHIIKQPEVVNKRYTTALENILVDSEAKKQTKKVEFCKTEIHFAPDSGRVNIVETDGKPLPSANFRRRPRRSSNSSVSSVSSSVYSEEEEETGTSLVIKQKEEAKVSVITEIQDSSPSEPTLELMDEAEELRGILKNKPVKPKQYHLGENMKDIDTFWGVKLRPTPGNAPIIESPPETSVDEVEEKKESAFSRVYSRLREEREELFDQRKKDFGYSTKISLAGTSASLDDHFVSKLEINETKTPQPLDSWPYCLPTKSESSSSSSRLAPIAPEDELKSISLIKSTLKSSPPSHSAAILAETTKIKHDLDEAFKDLLSVSASLREIENRSSFSPPTRPQSFSFRRQSFDFPSPTASPGSSGSQKPVPAPRKRPTTLDIKSPITPAFPLSPLSSSSPATQTVHVSPKISTVALREETTSRVAKVVEEKKSITVLNDKVNTPIHIQLYSPTNSLQRPTKQIKHPTPLPRSTLSDSESVVKPKVYKFVNSFQQQPLRSGTRQLKAHELAYFGVDGQRSETSKKVETSSSYRNGYSSATKYESSGDEIEPRSVVFKRVFESRPVLRTLEPPKTFVEIKENGYDRKTDHRRDEAILDELTRASEEMLNTVRSLEEDKEKERKRRSSKNSYHVEILETITEKPPARTVVGVPRHTRERSIQREERKSSLSSASSSECLSPFTRAARFISKSSSSVSPKKEPSISSSTSKTSSKSSNRECRRMLRTPSRELAQSQTRGSSSEDLTTSVVEPPRRIRRTKTTEETLAASVARRPRQPTPRDSPGTATPAKERVYTHRLRKVDNISKPSTTSTTRRISRTRAMNGPAKTK